MTLGFPDELEAVSDDTAEVDRVLDEFFEHGMARAGGLDGVYTTMWQLLRKSAGGGKRLRPKLVMASYAGLGGRDLGAAAQVGAAFELLHTALVIHDDVIDNDFRRRGRPNIAGHYRSSLAVAGLDSRAADHRGQSAAIIAGDLALAGAFTLLGRTDVAAPVRAKLLDLLDEAVFSSAAGEMLDLAYSALGPGSAFGKGPDAHAVLGMTRLKTAVYSFEAPLRAGAILAGAGAHVEDTLAAIGENTGVAYQLVDDLLGVFGKSSTTGKSTTSDLAEGKFTLLMAHAAGTREWSEIARIQRKSEPSSQDFADIRRLLEQCGARDHVQAVAAAYAQRGRELLTSSGLGAPLQAAIEGLLAEATARNH
ncbi:polyprenyl synthetase family protein [Arthrobacter sp. 35W]|uniref:polyprenyl synthetase family protein n=1 Tax=Arthrobacter sp. 35W TaxID=1132441 RepID=UPI0003F6F45C|nr:polyprenyl synthetase family protein [Arthrobacter sp. 35W]